MRFLSVPYVCVTGGDLYDILLEDPPSHPVAEPEGRAPSGHESGSDGSRQCSSALHQGPGSVPSAIPRRLPWGPGAQLGARESCVGAWA